MNSRNENKLTFKTRNTIPWSLECELERGETRQSGYEQYKITLEHDSLMKESMEALAVAAYCIIGFWSLGTCCCGMIGAIGGAWFVPVILQCCNRLTIIILASIFLSMNSSVSDTTLRNIDKLESQTDTDCSDEYSNFNISAAMAQMEESQSLLSSSTLFVAFTLIWIATEVCCGFCCVAVASTKGDCKCCKCDYFMDEFKEYLGAYKETN